MFYYAPTATGGATIFNSNCRGWELLADGKTRLLRECQPGTSKGFFSYRHWKTGGCCSEEE